MVCLAVALVYFLVFGAQFVLKKLVPGGDTQTLWSFHYIAIYSFRHFKEFIWWDPTALNGWPAYYLTYYGWANLMSPFQLGQLLFGELLSFLFGISITNIMIVQKTLLVVGINIVGIVLISTELIRDRVARLLPPLTYALCHMQFLGYTASGTVEALPAAIFLLYAMIFYNNRRTPASLSVLVLFAGIYLGSMNYVLLQSHVYALGLFSLLLVLFSPGLAASLWHNAGLLRRSPLGLACLVIGLLFMVSGVATFLAGVIPNLPRFARLKSGTIPFDFATANPFDAPNYAIASTEIWTNLFWWIPYSDFHLYSMKFDPFSGGLEYRYIGVATLPLIVVALLRVTRNRYTIPLALSFFLCTAFISYTWLNLPFALLISETNLFKNIRTMALVMPRDVAGLFPLFVAGVGLDCLVSPQEDSDTGLRPDASWTRGLTVGTLAGLMVLAVVCLVLLAVMPSLTPVRKSLGHVGIYLLVFAGMALVLLCGITEHAARRAIALALLILVFTDLSISASDQWIKNNVNGRYYHDRSAVSFRADWRGISALTTEDNSWPGPNYNGMVHNMVHGGPYFGLREWLVLVTRPAWQPVLDTWNPATRMVTKYPYFKFFTNGAFIPLSAISQVDSVPRPAVELPGAIVRVNGQSAVRLDGRLHPIAPGEPGFVESASLGWADRYWFAGWAVDRKSAGPARMVLVFVGNDLWYIGSPSNPRPDVGVGDPKILDAGFTLPVDNLPKEAREGKASVRVFALMGDATAVELQYSKDYPFSSAPESPLAQFPSTRGGITAGSPMFYIHDRTLVRPGVPAQRLYDVRWEVLDFTLNRVKVRVRLPQEAFMLYLDNYDRFWTARVNGQRMPVYRANFTFKTIVLPAGESIVEWRYNPYPAKIAWTVYYLTFAGFLALVWRWHREQRPAPTGTRN